MAPDDLFGGTTLLGDMETADRESLLRSAVIRTFAKGDAIVDASTSRPLMVLRTGCAALSAEQGGGRAVVKVVQAPDVLNLAGVLVRPWPKTIWRAVSPCTVAFLSGAVLRDAVARDPRLASRVASSLAQAYLDMVETAAAQRLQSAPHRLAQYLLGLAPVELGATVVHLPYTKQVLASLLGMTPENLSRAIAALASHDVVIRGALVTIKNPQKLRQAFDGPRAKSGRASTRRGRRTAVASAGDEGATM